MRLNATECRDRQTVPNGAMEFGWANEFGRVFMDRTPPPVSLAAALALPRTPGRSAEVFVDGELEVRFAARPTNGPQVPHERDELYFVAASSPPGRRGIAWRIR
jgi:hypothetical protein